ncbi:MAG: ABC transporter permease [Sphaerochaeta sp.]
MRSVKQNLILLLASAILLIIWQVGSVLLDSQILLPGLVPVFSTLLGLVGEPVFFPNVLFTVLRALESFFIILVSASILGVLAGRYQGMAQFLRPFVTTLKAVPVMSVILLAFIWFTSGTVPVFSAFLMGFPVMYVQIEMGVRRLDPNLEEMCCLYDFSKKTKLLHFLIPSMVPYFVTGAKTALSMVWKVVIAAEVLTVPQYGVGSRMQLAQVQLETATVLSWTLVAVFLTAFGDLVFTLVVDGLGAYKRHLDARRIPCVS